jgi:hypothetical protein
VSANGIVFIQPGAGMLRVSPDAIILSSTMYTRCPVGRYLPSLPASMSVLRLARRDRLDLSQNLDGEL